MQVETLHIWFKKIFIVNKGEKTFFFKNTYGVQHKLSICFGTALVFSKIAKVRNYPHYIRISNL